MSEDEAVVVAAEAAVAARVLPGPLGGAAAELAAAAPSGEVPAELVDILTQVVSTSLVGGRARQQYRAEGEKLLGAVLARTPTGRQHRAALAEVNQALSALDGRRLDGVQVSTRIPGNHTLQIATDGVTITLGFSTAGVRVESVAT